MMVGNTGSNVYDMGHSNIVLHVSPQSREIKVKTNYWDFKTKISTVKETIDKTQKQLMGWEKIFANDTSDKGLVFKTYKELIQLNTEKHQIIQLKMGRRSE